MDNGGIVWKEFKSVLFLPRKQQNVIKKVNNFNQTCSLYIEIDGKSLAKRNNVEYII